MARGIVKPSLLFCSLVILFGCAFIFSEGIWRPVANSNTAKGENGRHLIDYQTMPGKAVAAPTLGQIKPTPAPVRPTFKPVAPVTITKPTPAPVAKIPITPPSPTPVPITITKPTPAPITITKPTPAPVTITKPTPSPVAKIPITPPSPTPAPITITKPTPAPVTITKPTPSPVTPPSPTITKPTPAPVAKIPVTQPSPTPSPITITNPTPAPVTITKPTPVPVDKVPVTPPSPTPTTVTSKPTQQPVASPIKTLPPFTIVEPITPNPTFPPISIIGPITPKPTFQSKTLAPVSATDTPKPTFPPISIIEPITPKPTFPSKTLAPVSIIDTPKPTFPPIIVVEPITPKPTSKTFAPVSNTRTPKPTIRMVETLSPVPSVQKPTPQPIPKVTLPPRLPTMKPTYLPPFLTKKPTLRPTSRPTLLSVIITLPGTKQPSMAPTTASPTPATAPVEFGTSTLSAGYVTFPTRKPTQAPIKAGETPLPTARPTYFDGEIPTLADATLSSFANTIRITFTGDTDQAKIFQQSIGQRTLLCENWFKGGVSLFGIGTSCFFETSQVLVINIGRGGNVDVESTIVLLEGYIRPALAQSIGDPSIKGQVYVSPTYDIVTEPVRAEVTGPDEVTRGNAFVLDATSSIGSAGKAWLSIIWSYQNGPNTDLIEIKELRGLLSGKLDSSVFALGNITFQISLVNVFEELGTAVHSVLISEAARPSLQLQSGSSVTFDKASSSSFSLQSVLDFSALDLKGKTYWSSLTWSSSWIETEGKTFERVPVRDQFQLVVSSQSLQAGSIYNFQITAEAFASSAKVSLLTLRRKVSIKVSQPNPVALVKGGNRKLTVSSSLILDGSMSYDPGSLTPDRKTLWYAWACDAFTSPDTSTVSEDCNLGFQLPNAPKFEIPPFSFAPNILYQFTLIVGGDFGWERNNTAEPVLIYAVEAPILPLTVAVLGKVPSGSAYIVNRNEALRIQGNLDGSYSGLDCVFEELDHDLDLTDPNIAASTTSQRLASNEDPLSLVIRPGVLQEGSSYTFALSCTDSFGSSGFAATPQIVVSVPPRNGILEVFPETGFALGTSFQVSSSEWITDGVDGEVEFSFRLYKFSSSRKIKITTSETTVSDREGSRSIFLPSNLSFTTITTQDAIVWRASGLKKTFSTSLPFYCTWSDGSLMRHIANQTCDLLLTVVVKSPNGAISEIGYVVQISTPSSFDDLLTSVENSFVFDQEFSGQSVESVLQLMVVLLSMIPNGEDMSSGTRLNSIFSRATDLWENVGWTEDRILQFLSFLIELLESGLIIPEDFVIDKILPIIQSIVASLYRDIRTSYSASELEFGKVFVSNDISQRLTRAFGLLSKAMPLGILQQIRTLAQQLSRAQISRSISGEGAAIQSDLFSMKVERAKGSQFAVADISPLAFTSSGERRTTNFVFSASFLVEGELDVFLLNWDGINPHTNSFENKTRRLLMTEVHQDSKLPVLKTDVVEFSIRDPKTGQKYALSVEESNFVSYPITMDFELSDSLDANETFACGYFDEEKQVWSTEGCAVIDSNLTRVRCGCNHTTDFAAWARTEDIFVDTISGKGFTEGRWEDKWLIVFVLSGILLFCFTVSVVGIRLDRQDTYQYHRAISVLLVRRAAMERHALKRSFRKWAELNFEKAKLVEVLSDQRDNINSNVRAEHLSLPILVKTGQGGTIAIPPLIPYDDSVLSSVWYNIKMRSQLLGYFYQYDPVFNRFHRSLILAAVILGKLFLSAVFFHFELTEEYQLSDRLIIVTINMVAFTAFVMICTAVFIRIPPIPGTRWRYNSELRRLYYISQGQSRQNRRNISSLLGLDVFVLEIAKHLECSKAKVAALIFLAQKQISPIRERRSSSRFSLNFRRASSASKDSQDLTYDEDSFLPRVDRVLELLHSSVKLCNSAEKVDPLLFASLCIACEKMVRLYLEQKRQFFGDPWVCVPTACSSRKREERTMTEIIEKLKETRGKLVDPESLPAFENEIETFDGSSGVGRGRAGSSFQLLGLENPFRRTATDTSSEISDTPGSDGRRTRSRYESTASSKSSQRRMPEGMRRSFCDRLLLLLSEKQSSLAIKFWPYWTSYAAYTGIFLWCIFCTYFLLSWGLLSGNAVVFLWFPTMMFSLVLSLILFNPLLHLCQHLIGRWHHYRVSKRINVHNQRRSRTFQFVRASEPSRFCKERKLSEEERNLDETKSFMVTID